MLAICAILASLLPALPVQAAAPRQSDPPAPPPAAEIDIAEDKFGILSVTLSSSGATTPGGTVNLVLAATPASDLPAIEVQWELPDGGELIGGSNVESFGAVAAGSTVQSNRQVRFSGEGVYRVFASATGSPNDSMNVAPLGVLFFIVNAVTPAVSNRDPNPVDPRAGPMEAEIVSAEVGARVVDPASVDAASISETDDPCFNVTGKVTRIERRVTSSGVTETSGVAVANAVIEMREEDTLFDDSYGTKLTDAGGNYSFSFCDDDGVFDDELELYVRLRAELKDGGFTVVEVEDSSWIDEVYEFDSNVIDSEGGNYTINFNLNTERSAIFNIADAVWKAWRFWIDSGGDTDGDQYFDYSAEVHWEPGYGDDGSYYYWVWSEMTIADDPSDPDEWDDSVIMHEWGHMADDKYGCDDNPGGDHSVDTVIDPELAWGEGYPDYWQSAVRQANGYVDSNFYLDRNGAGGMLSVNLETYDSTRMDNLLNAGNELAVAAMLWDLNDNAVDGRTRGSNPTTGPWDSVSHGHAMIQQVYTDDTFEANGDVFDDTCSAFVYLLAWNDMGMPTDGNTAEVIVKNVSLPATIFSASAANAASAVNAASPEAQLATASNTMLTEPVQPADPSAIDAEPSGQEDYQWWKRVTMVVDNSASMAGAKIDGIKTLVKEQANDIAPDPEGAQFKLFTFNNLSTGITPRYTSLFRAPDVNQGIDQVAASGAADPSCPTYGLSALAQAAQTMRGGQAWLYTDGDSYPTISSAGMKQLLNDRGVRGSVVLLVGCGSLPPSQPNRTGAEMAYLGNAADASQPTGIVPYLLTALGSGGQFFYVNQNQLGSIGDVPARPTRPQRRRRQMERLCQR